MANPRIGHKMATQADRSAVGIPTKVKRPLHMSSCHIWDESDRRLIKRIRLGSWWLAAGDRFQRYVQSPKRYCEKIDLLPRHGGDNLHFESAVGADRGSRGSRESEQGVTIGGATAQANTYVCARTHAHI